MGKRLLKDQLNDEQVEAFKRMSEPGVNVFLTGEAGTGKSFLVNAFVEYEKGVNGKNILLCAPTGTAAQDINGMTIHRLFGAPVEIKKMAQKDPYAERSDIFKAADIIIIDEISMCRFDLFDFVGKTIDNENNHRKAASHRRVRNKDERTDPIKLIVVGDFFQLPPVLKSEDLPVLNELYGNEEFYKQHGFGEGFAFQSAYWETFGFDYICLKKVVRQENMEFKKYLRNLRYGINKTETVNWLNSKRSPFAFEDDDSVFLAYSNAQAKVINDRKLAEINNTERFFVAKTKGDVSDGEKFAEDELTLKVGAKVICTVNDSDKNYCNGTLGIVESFGNDVIYIGTKNGTVAVKQYDKSITKYVTRRVPVLDNDGNQVMEPELDSNGNQIYKTVKDFDGKEMQVPMTKPVSKTVIEEEEVGSFTQYPLKLAYAITVHKSQGKTFEKVNINPYCKNAGQLYTAISRCKSAENIFFNFQSTTNPAWVKPEYIITSEAVLKEFKRLWDE